MLESEDLLVIVDYESIIAQDFRHKDTRNFIKVSASTKWSRKDKLRMHEHKICIKNMHEKYARTHEQ